MRTRFTSQRRRAEIARAVLAIGLLTALFAPVLLTASQPAVAQDEEVIVGLITKTETNPFFVKMKEGATEAAKARGAKLLSGAGKTDGDNAGQVTAMENMIAAGAKTILITPSDSKAIVPAIRKARDKGVLVIALEPATATFIQALIDGRTLGDALAQAGGVDLGGALALLLRHGAIVAWRSGEAGA